MGRQAQRRQAQRQKQGRSGAARQGAQRHQVRRGGGSPPPRGAMPWWLGPWGLGAAVLVVAAVVVIFIVVNNANRSPSAGPQGGSGGVLGKPVPANVLATITKPDVAVLRAVGTGGYHSPWIALRGKPPILVNGKPSFVYIGAEYCPYCAAERWSMISALSRFGTFGNVRLMQSSSSDIYPDTSTFTLLHASFHSPYVNFLPVEEEDRSQNPLQKPNAVEAAAGNYDSTPYVPSADAQGIPFLNVNDQALAVSSGYLPSVINGQSWQHIASHLNNPSSGVAKAILGNANWISAAICKATKNKPASVCMTAPISGMEKKLKIG